MNCGSVLGTRQPVVMARIGNVTCGRSPLLPQTLHCSAIGSNTDVWTYNSNKTLLNGSLWRKHHRDGIIAHSTSPDREEEASPATPKLASTDVEEEPIWVRRERERELLAKQGGIKELPFGVYLLLSAIVAIAAVGSIFEFANKNPIFDTIYPDSPFYTPILGIFSVTGIPTAGYLFFKAVGAANAEAERMDKLDGVESKDNYFNRRDQ